MISLEQVERINELCNEIKNNRFSFPNCVEVYLFGSFLTKNCPNDIDVLVVYDDSECDVTQQLNSLMGLIESITFCPVDMTALSVAEKRETAFLEKLKLKYLRIPPCARIDVSEA